MITIYPFLTIKEEGMCRVAKQVFMIFPTSSYVSLTINGSVVNCFDIETSSYVSFTVNNNNVVAFDSQTAMYYNYCVV